MFFVKGQLISEWHLDVFIWTKKQKTNSVFLPYLSKIDQIKKKKKKKKKKMQILTIKVRSL